MGYDITGINYLPRYVVVLIDTSLLCFALAISILALRTNNISFYDTFSLSTRSLAVIGINLLFFRVFRTYAGLIRHSSFVDIIKLGLASLATFFSILIIHYFWDLFFGEKIFITVGLLLYTVLSFALLLIFRILVKQTYRTYKDYNVKGKKRIVIFGIDDHSISLGRALTSESGQVFHLEGFISDDKQFSKIRIAGKPVIPIKNSFKKTLCSLKVDGVLIIGKNLNLQEKNNIVNDCLACELQVFNAPLVEEWESSSQISQSIKAVAIEDLLDRAPINLDTTAISEDLQGKVILITGAAGSIGSEIVRQLAAYKPSKLVLVDQAETPLHEIELELKNKYPGLKCKCVLSTISNKYRMEELFKEQSFDIVYHAAAYKHVPMIEKNPREAIFVNILGTKNIAELSVQYFVKKFVMVSTDKAVNPTNIMGASKRAAEMFVQALQQDKSVKTQFITTRFGNVLGSNGSVIPHFRKQIYAGGPLTVTHRDIIRYFMTIPEACQLVLQAGTMGHGGEIFVFDMGEPVKILDLAVRMIKLSGLQPYSDIDIEFTGLRPGEKLYEELLNDSSQTMPTHNKKIMIAMDEPPNYNQINEKIKKLIKKALKDNDKQEIVKLLKNIVPEFKSKNSVFEVLDK